MIISTRTAAVLIATAAAAGIAIATAGSSAAAVDMFNPHPGQAQDQALDRLQNTVRTHFPTQNASDPVGAVTRAFGHLPSKFSPQVGS